MYECGEARWQKEGREEAGMERRTEGETDAGDRGGAKGQSECENKIS